MSWMRFLKRAKWDAERAREIQSYLETETADNVARGMSPADAAVAARRKFGNTTLVREEIYRMNTVSWLESIAQDIRYGARLLLASPGFTIVAILSLALGIGANTAIFQLIDAVRLRTLPIPNPHQLAGIEIVGGNQGMGMNEDYGALTRPIWLDLRRNHPGFASIFAWAKHHDAIGEGVDFQSVNSLYVSGELFGSLGLQPLQGRLLSLNDEHSCPALTTVVSDAFWKSKLGAHPIDANTKLMIDGVQMQVVGVTPPSFFGMAVGESFDIALPFCQPKELMRNLFDVSVMGRLRPGVTLARVSAQLAAISPAVMDATEVRGYDAKMVAQYRAFRLGAYDASSGVSNLRGAYQSPLWLLLGITGLVLLIACANLANLILARSSAREREIAVRLALGAARVRLLRQLLVESALLALTGAALAVALAQLLSRALVASLSTDDNGVTLAIATDWRVLLFAAAAAIATCIVAGVIPALRASGADPMTAIKTGGRGLTASRERFSLQRSIVVIQISVSLVLLVGALLFVRSFHKLLTLDPGMREENITAAYVGFLDRKLSTAQLEPLKRELTEDVRTAPGILDAASTTNVPLLGGSWEHVVSVGQNERLSKFTWTSPGYLDTMGIRLRAGRGFRPSDSATSQRVAIVNQAFVRRYLPGIDPIGQILRTHPEPGYPETVYEIVGVIADTKYSSLREATPPMTLAPASQYPAYAPWMALMIHSNLSPAAVADVVKRRIASEHIAVALQFKTFQTQIRNGLVRERTMALLSGFFGVLAALLATVGLYGVISYAVTRRSNEIGVRIALGAGRKQVVVMVMREAGLLLMIGAAIGTVLALAATRGASSLLFGLKSYDPLTLISAVTLLAVIAALASWIPARRASKLDPMAALRSE